MRLSRMLVFGAFSALLFSAGACGCHLGRLSRPGEIAIDGLTASTSGGFGATANSHHARPMTQEDESRIARATAVVLERSHYLHKPLSPETSAKHLNLYLDALDPQHIYLLQSDIDEFSRWKSTLDNMLKNGDVSPSSIIFKRFLQRFDAQIDYINHALKTETFTFDGSETYAFDRKNMPYPKDVADAQRMWHDRLRYEYLQEKLNKEKPDEIVKAITRRYSRIGRALHEYDSDDVFELYLNALAHVYDPHTDYYGKSTLETFDIHMKLSLFGIGAQLRSVDGYCTIDSLIPGGPAIKCKQLKVGDRIVGVAQADGSFVDIIDMKIDRAVDLIRGTKGTIVRLEVIPVEARDPSTRKVVRLVRDEIHLEEAEAKARIDDIPGAAGKRFRLGVIDLPSFYTDQDGSGKTRKSVTDDVARLVRKLESAKVQGIVLDLRRNGGGSLGEAERLTGLFIKRGPVVQVKNAAGEIREDDVPDPGILYSGPLAVLTNRESASASEIVAGALQDYGRALIVGDNSTFGKGTVQAMIPLANLLEQMGNSSTVEPGALKLTIQKFYRASGSSTQKKGVIPDIVLPSLESIADIGEQSLDNPLPWDTIPSARFTKFNVVQPYLPFLRKHSQARVLTDKDFVYLRQRIDDLKKMLATKTVSMNEQQRMKEIDEAKRRQAAREAELKSRPASKVKEYLLTVRLAELPGLPPPVATTAPPVAAHPAGSLPSDDDPDALAQANTTAAEPDAALDETKRILEDLITVSAHH